MQPVLSPPRAPEHHIEAAVGFADPPCILVSGWVHDRHDAIASLVMYVAGEDFALEDKLVWYRRPDVIENFGGVIDSNKVGFWVMLSVTAADLAGRVQLRFAMKDGSRRLGEVVEVAPYEATRHLGIKGLLAQRSPRGFRDLLDVSPRPIDLLRLMAADLSEQGGVVEIERATWLPDGRMFLVGVVREGAQPLERMTLIDEVSGRSRHILGDTTWFHRGAGNHGPGSSDQGFVALIDLGVDPSRETHVSLYCRTHDTRLFRIPLRLASSRGATNEVVAALLGAIPEEQLCDFELMDRHVGPALDCALNRRPRVQSELREIAFGTPPTRPEVTIAILLGDDPNALRYQFATLCDDAEIRAADIVVVPRTARVADGVSRVARFVYEHFALPFRILDGLRTTETPEVINAVTRVVRTEFLLLLGSEVLATSPGWLSKLVNVSRLLGDAAAVGPQLLDEDGTIYQGPTYLVPSPWSDRWHVDECASRGFPPSLADDGLQPVVVDALSLDCLLVRPERLREVDGVSEAYVSGKFADLDLCARLTRAGRRLYYVPTASLELPGRRALHRFSRREPMGFRVDLYNCWRFNTQRKALPGGRAS